MTTLPPTKRPFRFRWDYVIVAAILLFAVAISVSFFGRIPIQGTMLAVDWQSLYSGLQGGHVVYKGGSVMIAPWSLPAVLPLGFFSQGAGWGMLSLLTLTVLALSVPQRRHRLDLVGILLLVTSWLAVRQVVDGNFEAVVIAGVALVVYGYSRQHLLALAVGLLLATAKPQETWLLMIVLGVYLLRTRSLRRNFELAMILAPIVLLSLIIFGKDWINAMTGIVPPPGSILDISLWAALHRLGVSPLIAAPVWIVFFAATLIVSLAGQPTLSREKAGMLIAMSLLLSPYAAGDSVLTVLAIGIIPMWQQRRRLGWIVLLVIDFQYVFNFTAPDFLYWNGAYYWTATLIAVWAVWASQFYRMEFRKPPISKVLSVVDNH